MKNITLHLPHISSKKGDDLIMSLNKDDLLALLKPLKDFLRDKTISFSEQTPPSMKDLIARLKDKALSARLLKEELAKIYTSFSFDSTNIYATAAPGTPEGKCWEQILLSPEIESDTLSDILKRDIVVRYTGYWSSFFFTECLFSHLVVLERATHYSKTGRWGEYSYFYNLSVSPRSREKLAALYFGKESVTPKILSDLPDDNNLQKLNFEKFIPADLTYLSALGMTGIPLSETKGTVSATKMKAIKSSFHTGQFPTKDDDYPFDRSELLVYAYFNTSFSNKKDTKGIDPGTFARNVVSKLPKRIVGPQFGLFLPAFKGFTKVWTEMSTVEAVTAAIDSLLKPSAEGWMSLSNLKMRFLCCDLMGWTEYAYNSLFTSQGRSKHTLRRVTDNLDSFCKSSGIKWFDEVDFPFVLHWIKFLCAIGMLEIAVDPDAAPDDPLEGMRYARLTPLGRYAYAIDNKYTAPEQGEACQLEFDDKNLILTIVGKNCPYTLFLEQISSPIGSTRFKITPESILKGCINDREAEARIDNLKKIIKIDTCPNLSSAINEARLRTKCTEKTSKSYSILKISRQVPGFAEFLTSEKSIREHCLFAESSLILIEKSFLPQFKTICNNHGYLVE